MFQTKINLLEMPLELQAVEEFPRISRHVEDLPENRFNQVSVRSATYMDICI